MPRKNSFDLSLTDRPQERIDFKAALAARVHWINLIFIKNVKFVVTLVENESIDQPLNESINNEFITAIATAELE